MFLRQVSIFARLEPEDLKQIADRATERVFQPGDDLMREGEPGDELFILIEGQAKVTKKMDDHRTVRPIRTAKAGEPVGELAILLEQKRSATVTADGGPVRTLVISRDAFKAIMRDRPQVALGLIRSLAEKLSQS